jgi:hypothetical protein
VIGVEVREDDAPQIASLATEPPDRFGDLRGGPRGAGIDERKRSRILPQVSLANDEPEQVQPPGYQLDEVHAALRYRTPVVDLPGRCQRIHRTRMGKRDQVR